VGYPSRTIGVLHLQQPVSLPFYLLQEFRKTGGCFRQVQGDLLKLRLKMFPCQEKDSHGHPGIDHILPVVARIMPSSGTVAPAACLSQVIFIPVIQMTGCLVVVIPLVFAIHLHATAPEVKPPHCGYISIVINFLPYREIDGPPHTGNLEIIGAGGGHPAEVGIPHLPTDIFLGNGTGNGVFENHFS